MLSLVRQNAKAVLCFFFNGLFCLLLPVPVATKAACIHATWKEEVKWVGGVWMASGFATPASRALAWPVLPHSRSRATPLTKAGRTPVKKRGRDTSAPFTPFPWTSPLLLLFSFSPFCPRLVVCPAHHLPSFPLCRSAVVLSTVDGSVRPEFCPPPICPSLSL